MNTVFRQETRAGRLELASGLGLALVAFRGAEHLNALFEYELDCVSPDGAVEFDVLLGTHASVVLKSYDASETPFDGIVTEARWLGPGADGHRFRLQLRPWLWLAGRRRNQRIFHNKTAPEILSELLSAYLDAGRVEDRLRADYPVLEYTVQHRETDLAFACRLMERHGINYHFEHVALAHTMVLTDRAEDHADIGPRPFHPHEGHHRGEPEEHFWDWQPARRVTTGAVKLTDYNFKTPNAAMLSEAMGDADHPQGQIESFDWPGDHPDPARGKVVARLRMQAERGQDPRYSAEGDVIGLRAGARVTLSGDKVPGTGGAYLCLSAVHSYAANRYGSGGGDEGAAHRAQFTLLPAEAPLVPERKTPLALAPGPQTARVVGEGEIDCDEFGRILVQFHWDLDGAWSMRCRVSQNWGGNGWGGMVIPRIGMEVIVEFLDGDPDKPIVTGCVYNGKNDVPYPLPEHKTRSTFKTQTHKGDGFNELRFEDENGKEEIRLHAEKDMNTFVRNNKVDYVARNRVDTTLLNWVEQNFGYRYLSSMAGLTISTGLTSISQLDRLNVASIGETFSSHGYSIDGLESIAQSTQGLSLLSEGNRFDSVGENATLIVDGNSRTQVRGSATASFAKSFTQGVGENHVESVGKSWIKSVGQEILFSCGKSRLKLKSDGTIEMHGVKLSIIGEDTVDIDGGRIDLN